MIKGSRHDRQFARGARALRCLLVAATIPTTLTACAAPTRYMGIPFTPGAAPADLQSTARLAATGDKHAQLALGIAYEEGRGVARDLRRATKLYRRAAADSGGLKFLYAPAVGKSGPARAIPTSLGPASMGLLEARSRLQKLEDAQSKSN